MSEKHLWLCSSFPSHLQISRVSFKELKPAEEGQMVQSAGLLRARHACGLSSFRSLCRLMPTWIQVNLCQAGGIKENIYMVLLCGFAFEENRWISASSAPLFHQQEGWRVTLHCSGNLQNGRGCNRAADMRSFDLGIVSFFALAWVISSL